GRARRHPGRGPPLHGRGERVLDRLLGDVDVAEDADQDGHRAPVLLAEDTLDLRRRRLGGQPWNGRTSIGSVVARAALLAHASAASRSGASMIRSPPTCSLPSANGPSVSSTSPSWSRTTVAVLAACSPPLKTHAPAALISSTRAATSRITGSRTSGAGGGPSGWTTVSRYRVRWTCLL